MNTKLKEQVSEWMLAVAKGMISVGCFGLFLKYLRETWWGVENAKAVKNWYRDPVEVDAEYVGEMTLRGGESGVPESKER